MSDCTGRSISHVVSMFASCLSLRRHAPLLDLLLNLLQILSSSGTTTCKGFYLHGALSVQAAYY